MRLSLELLLPLLLPQLPGPLRSAAHLAEAVHDDEDAPQEVAAGRIIPHDVFVPHLDGDQRAEQLAQLLNDQIKLSLQDNQASETQLLSGKQKNI